MLRVYIQHIKRTKPTNQLMKQTGHLRPAGFLAKPAGRHTWMASIFFEYSTFLEKMSRFKNMTLTHFIHHWWVERWTTPSHKFTLWRPMISVEWKYLNEAWTSVVKLNFTRKQWTKNRGVRPAVTTAFPIRNKTLPVWMLRNHICASCPFWHHQTPLDSSIASCFILSKLNRWFCSQM